MKRTLLTSVLSAVAIGCTACASVDGGGSGIDLASDTASPALYSASASAGHAEWEFTLYPANDDDGNPMPPVPAELQR